MEGEEDVVSVKPKQSLLFVLETTFKRSDLIFALTLFFYFVSRAHLFYSRCSLQIPRFQASVGITSEENKKDILKGRFWWELMDIDVNSVLNLCVFLSLAQHACNFPWFSFSDGTVSFFSWYFNSLFHILVLRTASKASLILSTYTHIFHWPAAPVVGNSFHFNCWGSNPKCLTLAKQRFYH